LEEFYVYSEKLRFNFSVVEAYKSIAGVQVVEIDANQYKTKVLKQIQEAVQHLI
jgi:thymidylate kinase